MLRILHCGRQSYVLPSTTNSIRLWRNLSLSIVFLGKQIMAIYILAADLYIKLERGYI